MLRRVFAAFCICCDKYTCFLFRGIEEWDEDLKPVSEAFLPLVGLVIGLAWWMLALLCWWLLPGFLGAALAALFPFAVTGFENLFAFARVSADLLEKKSIAQTDTCLRILPVVLLLLQFSACVSLGHIFALAMIPVLSRGCLFLMQLKAQKKDAEGEREEPQVPVSLIRIEQGITAGALVLMLLFAGGAGLLCGAAVLACSWAILRSFARKGSPFSDDLCGFVLTASEFCGLLLLSIL